MSVDAAYGGLRSIQASTEGRLYRSPVTAAGTRFVHTHSAGDICAPYSEGVCALIQEIMPDFCRLWMARSLQHRWR